MIKYHYSLRCALAIVFFVADSTLGAVDSIPSDLAPSIIVSTETEAMAPEPYKPTWQSLEQYEVPAWFRDAKFGIWAHWGPQCQPERGDWYARHMYVQGHWQYQDHLERYGHPSVHGFKDVIHEWKVENWDPAELIALYKRAGAQYFVALANHHDNLDLWNSKHHAWNSVAVGPKKDIVGGWAEAARDQGLRFGVSVHAAHAWLWYEPCRGSDKDGPEAGVPYDGNLTKADGKGTWWEGLDPQELYAQDHELASNSTRGSSVHEQWNWGNGATPPDQAYCQTFYDRTVDLINQIDPDLIYFDDSALPLWPVSDAGLKIAAHFYNKKVSGQGSKTDAVLFGKVLNEQQRRCMVWDIERGQSNVIEPIPWQTDTCLGSWHYDRGIYERGEYKSAVTVIRTLVDVVSKNGNLLLSVPVRGDGTIDDKERAIVEGVADWMDVNRESILGTRPWRVCGEGPQLADAAPISAQGFNEGKGRPFTNRDVRYTQKDNVVYAFVMGKPDGAVLFTALSSSAGLLDRNMPDVTQLGGGRVSWRLGKDGLAVTPNLAAVGDRETPVVFRVSLAR